jgi:hypothetical protein
MQVCCAVPVRCRNLPSARGSKFSLFLRSNRNLPRSHDMMTMISSLSSMCLRGRSIERRGTRSSDIRQRQQKQKQKQKQTEEEELLYDPLLAIYSSTVNQQISATPFPRHRHPYIPTILTSSVPAGGNPTRDCGNWEAKFNHALSALPKALSLRLPLLRTGDPATPSCFGMCRAEFSACSSPGGAYPRFGGRWRSA